MWSEERVKQPKTKSAEQALSSLMRQCARAERSSGDAMRLMARWGVPTEQRAAVVQRLIQDRFIDDRRFAAAYIREKVNLSGWGARKIASSLRQKGVAASIVEELLSQLDKESMAETLASKIRRKAGIVKHKDKYDLKSKLIRYGISLGYDYSTVLDSVAQVIVIEE